MGSLWTQLLLQLLTDLFETLQVFLSWSEDVHHFFDFFFQIRLLLEKLPCGRIDYFETMHTCSTWSVDVHVVLGLSSRYFLSTFSTKFFQNR